MGVRSPFTFIFRALQPGESEAGRGLQLRPSRFMTPGLVIDRASLD